MMIKSIDLASRSPVSVVDVSLLERLGQENSKLLGHFENCTKSLPFVDSVTASTDDDTDSLSTLSALSLDKEASCSSLCEDCSESKRSIFSHYWEKTGQHPATLKRRSASDEQAQRTQEVVQPRAPQDTPKSSGPPSPGRRSVLSKGCNLYASAPSLPTFDESSRHERSLTRKTMSSNDMRSSSCLRESRYSRVGGKRWSSERSSSTGVKFSSKVDVHHFVPPIEIFSSGDWAKHFMI